MKIVHLVSYFQPQMGYQEYYLAREHHAMGHDVTVITSDRYFPFPEYNTTSYPVLGNRMVGAGTFEEYGITVIRLPVLFEKSARVWLKGLKKKLLEIQPDIIISHGMFNFSTIRLVYYSLPFNTRIIIDDHMTQNLLKEGFLSGVSYAFFRFFFRNRIQSRASKIVGVYENTVHLLQTKMGFTGKVEWISMGSDTSQFYPDENLRVQTRARLGIKNEVVIIYTGKINESKKVHLLVEVLDDEAFKTLSFCLLVVGGVAESYREVWETAMAGAKFRLLYHPPVKGVELQEWFNAADIAAWPAHTTISSLDAAACGCAIICPDFIKERVAHHNGIAIPEGNRDALKQALLTLLHNPGLLQEMKTNSAEYIRSGLNWKAIAQKFIT